MKRIDILPDDVLLEIFNLYVNMYPLYEVKLEIEERWFTSVEDGEILFLDHHIA